MAETMLSRRAFAGCCAALALAAGTRAVAAEQTLTLAFIPQENPEKLLGDIEVITDWLADEIGVPVKGYVTLDHAAAVEALRSGGADISFSGALPYVLAHDQVGAEVLLSEVYRGRPSYVARIFVRKDSGIDDLAALEGRTIAFADPISEFGLPLSARDHRRCRADRARRRPAKLLRPGVLRRRLSAGDPGGRERPGRCRRRQRVRRSPALARAAEPGQVDRRERADPGPRRDRPQGSRSGPQAALRRRHAEAQRAAEPLAAAACLRPRRLCARSGTRPTSRLPSSRGAMACSARAHALPTGRGGAAAPGASPAVLLRDIRFRYADRRPAGPGDRPACDRARRAGRRGRPERQRQDHAAAAPERLAARRPRARPGSSASGSCRAAASAASSAGGSA